MEIVLQKDPFEYRKFWYVLKYDDEILDNNDAEILIGKICNKLTKKTKMRWGIRSCVGGKCVIATQMIFDRETRKKWKGQKIILDNISYIR